MIKGRIKKKHRIVVLILLILLLICNVTSLYKGHYNEIILHEYATVVSPDGNYAIEIKYIMPLGMPYPGGNEIKIYCIDLRGKRQKKIEYICTIDERFNPDKDPQIHYNMKWTEEGVSMITYTEVEIPPTRYVIKWKNVFQQDPPQQE